MLLGSRALLPSGKCAGGLAGLRDGVRGLVSQRGLEGESGRLPVPSGKKSGQRDSIVAEGFTKNLRPLTCLPRAET